MEIDKKYFSINELVERGLGSASTLKRLIRDGKLPSYKFGRSRKIAASDLETYINSCRK